MHFSAVKGHGRIVSETMAERMRTRLSLRCVTLLGCAHSVSSMRILPFDTAQGIGTALRKWTLLRLGESVGSNLACSSATSVVGNSVARGCYPPSQCTQHVIRVRQLIENSSSLTSRVRHHVSSNSHHWCSAQFTYPHPAMPEEVAAGRRAET